MMKHAVLIILALVFATTRIQAQHIQRLTSILKRTENRQVLPVITVLRLM